MVVAPTPSPMVIAATKGWVSDSLVLIGVQLAFASAVYGAVFLFFGINESERQLYLAKATELATRWRMQAVSEGA